MKRDMDLVRSLLLRVEDLCCLRNDSVSGQGATSGTNFTRSSEPASWMA
jgi:hypothetical protein